MSTIAFSVDGEYLKEHNFPLEELANVLEEAFDCETQIVDGNLEVEIDDEDGSPICFFEKLETTTDKLRNLIEKEIEDEENEEVEGCCCGDEEDDSDELYAVDDEEEEVDLLAEADKYLTVDRMRHSHSSDLVNGKKVEKKTLFFNISPKNIIPDERMDVVKKAAIEMARVIAEHNGYPDNSMEVTATFLGEVLPL